MSLLSKSDISNAFAHVCHQRRRWPADADIWHLRFHQQQLLPQILGEVNSGTYRFLPLQRVQNAQGESRVLWSSADAVVLKALTDHLARILPVSPRCLHIKGHGGGKRHLIHIHNLLLQRRFGFVCRTDIRGYYRHIRKDVLFTQLQQYIRSPAILSLLHQFLHYTVEYGGTFYTPVSGIPRSSSLSPLLAAFHLTETDDALSSRRNVFYVRYMDDFLMFTRTRWHLRHAVKNLNMHFARYGFEQHPDKTSIGRVEKGFDWLGYWFNDTGCAGVAPRSFAKFVLKLRRLYEQTRYLQVTDRQNRVGEYVRRWMESIRPRSIAIHRLIPRCVCRRIRPPRDGQQIPPRAVISAAFP